MKISDGTYDHPEHHPRAKDRRHLSRISPALTISLAYLIYGVLWIFYSDQIAAGIASSEGQFQKFSNMKGWFFVGVTALLLYLLLRAQFRNLERANRKLAQSEQHLRLAQQTARTGSWELSGKNKELTWSDTVFDLLGVCPKTSAISADDFFKTVHPEDRKGVEQAFEDSLKPDGPPYDISHRIIRADTGEVRYMYERGTHIRDADGNIIQSIGIIQDITEPKRNEERLLASEKRFRTICENAPVLITGFDENGQCIMWNEQCRKTFGWTHAEIFAHDAPLTLLYPDPAVCAEVKRATASDLDGQFRELHPLTKDGRTLITLWANFGLPNGQVFSLGYDDTERKQAEDQLRQSEAILRKSQEIARVGSWNFDVSTGKVSWSDELYCIFEIDPEEGSVTYEKLLERVHPEDRDYHDQIVEQLKTERHVSFEYRVLLPHGDLLWISGQGEALRNEAGDPVLLSGIVQDVTEQKRVEEELRKSRDELELRVEERTKELRTIVNAMAGRENRMAELKGVIQTLRTQLDQAGIAAHDSIEQEDPDHNSV
ncbi:PAS domain S-box protein [Pontiellaceae bacterium B1224]|nr:PAS domain S-box protein [Pontiellaceae bacterium B1224]